ncbi:cysteine desulfurase [Leuconostocaceae bacterium ESL0958]|nr:cysteine desulfurase [Leuconostocaceae bacterium ESL0958]
MAFQTRLTAPEGSYQINPNIKKYALLDLGFFQNKAGAYTLQRSLQPALPIDQAVQLKVAVNADLTKLKIQVVSAADLPVSIEKRQDAADLLTLYRYFMQELVDRQVVEKVV